MKADEIRERIGAHAQQSGGFYIHVRDRGYPDAPWPYERRFGPYPLAKNALEQAANDVALGLTEPDELLGIYSEAESLKRAYPEPVNDKDGRTIVVASADDVGKTKHTRAQVEKRANEIRTAMAADARAVAQAQLDALDAVLPAGIKASDVLALAKDQLGKNPALVPTASQEDE